jgi:hypothetical protein
MKRNEGGRKERRREKRESRIRRGGKSRWGFSCGPVAELAE